MMKPEYAFCESSGAGSLQPWHIRKLSEKGKKCGGGIDTPSLCGRVDQKNWGGWDLEGVEPATYGDLERLTDCKRRHVCKACADKYREEFNG
jgi:hypothetical protein